MPLIRPQTTPRQNYRWDDHFLDKIEQLGALPFDDTEQFLVVAIPPRELTTRTGKKQQYDLAKRILKGERASGDIFVFYNNGGHFRFSLVTAHYYPLAKLGKSSLTKICAPATQNVGLESKKAPATGASRWLAKCRRFKATIDYRLLAETENDIAVGI